MPFFFSHSVSILSGSVPRSTPTRFPSIDVKSDVPMSVFDISA